MSGLAGRHILESAPGTLIRHWFGGAFELVVSRVILSEVERTLDKPFYRSHRSSRQIGEAFAALVQLATIVVPSASVSGIATHPEDDLILATAASAGADYLVTGDRTLLQVGGFRSVQLISPRDFLDVLELNDHQALSP
ncbi:MAG: putative toxin-antitoxin system toxin component, PIN family [Thermomicrobiales bacterium]|nr:putative toxin-antitoxin system toxin component, PIN family [Thermomicrobiales bacterium]